MPDSISESSLLRKKKFSLTATSAIIVAQPYQAALSLQPSSAVRDQLGFEFWIE